MSRTHHNQTPEPPQLAPLNAAEYRLETESLPDDRASHPISQAEPGHPVEETLQTGQLLPSEPPTPITSPPPSFVNSPTVPIPTHFNCGIADSTPSYKTLSDSATSVSLLVLCIILGVVVGCAMLCWCCWSPGWFFWRISIFRFLPCCNSACASCQHCANRCTHSKEHRLAKVTPQSQLNGTPAGTLVTSADETLSAAALYTK